jgi:hypothetical protein
VELTPNMTTRALVTAGALIVGGVIAYNSPRKSNHARNDSKDSPKKVQFKKDNVLIEKKKASTKSSSQQKPIKKIFAWKTKSTGGKAQLHSPSINTTHRKRTKFITDKRTSAPEDDETENKQTEDKFHNLTEERLYRTTRLDSYFEPKAPFLRQRSDDIDDETSEQGYAKYKYLRENLICKFLSFFFVDIMAKTVFPILLLVGFLVVLLSFLDGQTPEDGNECNAFIKYPIKIMKPISKTSSAVLAISINGWDQLKNFLPPSIKEIVNKLQLGVFASAVFSYLKHTFYNPFIDEMNFSDSGFTDRVSISINTLEKQPEGGDETRSYRQELVMRTVKEMALDELIPNQSALKLMKSASEAIELKEDGPVVALYDKGSTPCGSCGGGLVGSYLSSFIRRCCCERVCCINKDKRQCTKGGFCLCLCRIDSWCCGHVKYHYLYCDPIVRFHTVEAKAKKRIHDQIKNQLSFCTTGSHFMGYEMGLPTKKLSYVWGLTYEQPMKSSDERNYKYRILLARKELVEFTLDHDSWDVFTQPFTGKRKINPKDIEYQDRRWVHLRTIGQIMRAKKNLVRPINEIDNIKDEKDKKICKDWLDTFFVGEVAVVSLLPTPDTILSKRAWEEDHPFKDAYEKWKANESGGDDTVETSSRKKISKKTVRIPSANRETDLKLSTI